MKRFALLIPFLILLGSAGSAFALPVHNVTQATDYSTIQAAINAAAPGDAITVDAGTYAEHLTIPASLAGLSIAGASEGSVLIDASSGSGYGITVTADDVTLSDFSLKGAPASSAIRYGIHVSGATFADQLSFTLHDVTVYDFYRTGIDVNGGDGVTIYNVTATDNGGAAIAFSDCNNVDIYDVTTSGSPWGGIAIYTWGRYHPLGATGIVISGTNSFGESAGDNGGLYIESGNYNTPASPYPISYGTTGTPDVLISTTALTHALRSNQLNNDAPYLHERTRFYGSLTQAHDAAVGSPSHSDDGRFIEELGASHLTVPYVVGGLGSIQAAVDYAVDGDLITIDPGTFEEQVEVTKDVTLDGAGVSTIIMSPVSLALSFTTSAANYPIVYIHDTDNATVQNLTVDGAGRGNTNVRFMGVGFHNAGGLVSACTVTGVRNTPFSGAQHGIAIYAYNEDAVSRSISLQNCDVNDFQKGGIALNASATTALSVDVSGCDVAGAGATTVTAQNGIQVFGELITGNIDGNTVDGIAYDNTAAAIKYVATSILDFYTDVDITNNVTTNGHVGVYKIDGAGTIGSNDFTIVKVGVYAFGIIATDPPAAVPTPFDSPAAADKGGIQSAAGAASLLVVDVTDNTLVFSGGDNTDTYGIEADAGYGADDIALTVTGNSVSGFDYGVVVTQCASSCAAGVFTSVLVNNNEFLGNSSAGLYSDVGYLTVDGSCNWWGDTFGPNDPPTNLSPGDAVVGDVSYSPWLDGSISGTPSCSLTGNPVTPVAADSCLTAETPCNTVSFEIARSDAVGMRGFSVTFTLSPELELCTGSLSDVQESTYLSNIGGTAFQVYGSAGTYTVDGSILGLPCGVTAATGTLFTVNVKASGSALPEDIGTVTVTSVTFRDCTNAPISAIAGGVGTLSIDTSAAAAMTGLAATQVKSGNDTDGTTKIDLTWTTVTEPDADQIEIYRAGYGDYPEYDNGTGAVPTAPSYPPSGPWTLAGTVAASLSSYTDEPSTRDFWYYTAFVIDVCGNVSPVSNMTDGTLGYHLGDVRPYAGVGGPPYGDNSVGLLDISALGDHYGIFGFALYDTLNYYDVGPTTDYSVDARPEPDNQIQFEDLMMFAINYAQVSKPGIRPEGADQNAIALVLPEDLNGMFEVGINASSVGTIQGMTVPLQWDARVVEPVDYSAGEFMDHQLGQGMVLSPKPGTVDAVVFGGTMAGTGELARVRFQRIAPGDPGIGFGAVQARDSENKRVELATETVKPGVALTTRLLPSMPNPFHAAAGIRFALREAGPVQVEVYSVNGRLVRTLADGTMSAGEHTINWDGLDRAGREVASGSYVIRFATSEGTESQRIVRLR